ncbi:hypothetical protein HPB47_013171 [Ixodes persulcatus]|uniref:Uncharacterized protein n=1 Tax=Ixodes persulcatus TaxID=34615 RepID=A0AC60NRH8_IXOPE|nr:hypothetical protein HPB47_013171 [Ixodes persulcatus]
MFNGAAALAKEADQASADYRMIMPMLPSGKRLAETVFLHGDPQGRPYRTQDFADAREETVGMKHVVGLGAFQFNHVWVCTLDSTDNRERLVALKEITVKGKRCIVIDPNLKEAVVRVNWLPTFVTDEEVCKALVEYGNVTKICREKWKSPSAEYEVETSTRFVTITMKEGKGKEDLPHQCKVAGYPILLYVPGRPPMCLRCGQLGHMRRQCRASWCRHCRSYGHLESECVPMYAAKTKCQANMPLDSDLLDDGECTGGGSNGTDEAGRADAPVSNQTEAATPKESSEEGSEPVEEEQDMDVARAPKEAATPQRLTNPPAPAAAPVKTRPSEQGASSKETSKVTRQSARQKPKRAEQFPPLDAHPGGRGESSENAVPLHGD